MPSDKKHFNIITLGCKINIYESESISYNLEKSGFILQKDSKKSDIIIINTCTVTSKADAKSRNIIRKVKRENPSALLIICGCLVNTDIQELLALGIGNIFIANADKDKIETAISKYYTKNPDTPLIYQTDKDGSFNFKTGNMSQHSRAFLKVQDGCNNHCTYCKIPIARGEERSKNLDDIYNEIDAFIKNGYEEIVLTGINLGSYNFNNITFPELLIKITERYNKTRFRISSIEPQYINNAFLEAFKKENVCKHIHLPLQNGSDKILKLMNRKYNLNEYSEKIKMIRSVKDKPFISTDLIIGFPNELEDDFNSTITFIKQINFSYIHIFSFSPRAGTEAFCLKPKIPERIRDERVKEIKKIMDKMSDNYRKQFLNKNLEVIIEKKHHDYYIGRADNYLSLHIESDEVLIPKKRYNVIFNKIEKDKNYGIKISPN